MPDLPNTTGSSPVSSQAGPSIPTPNQGQTSGLSKEHAPSALPEIPQLEEQFADVELEPALERAGVEKISETIHLPPDLKKIGVEAIGPTQPVTYTGIIKLPLADDKIVSGRKVGLASSFRWLAEWCWRELLKKHIQLVVRGNRITRENV